MVLLVLAAGAVDVQSGDPTKFEERSDQLHQLFMLDRAISEEALRVRLGLTRDFDRLTSMSLRCRDIAENLEFDQDSSGMAAVEEYLEVAARRDEFVESLKSEFAILRNSLAYLPEAVQWITDQASVETHAFKELELQVTRFA